MSGFAQAALPLAAQNLSVFPVHYVREDGRCSCGNAACEHPGKHPDTPHGFKDATTNPHRIELWGRRSPHSNLGIATEESGLLVVDADCKNGARGLKEWARLVAELGADLEDTAMVRTQSGGLHILYRAGGYEIPSSVGALAPGIDIRAQGGFIVAPPSVGPLGPYAWVEGHELDRLCDLPPKLAERLLAKTPGTENPPASGSAATLALIPRGERNAALTSFAGVMRRPGMQEDEILAALRQVNANRCSPPLPDDEVVRIAESVAGYDPQGPGSPPADSALLTCLADVRPEPVEFLWQGRIVRAKLNMIYGEPGLGKSFLALDIVAHVSRGLVWPDGGSPPVGTVILLTAEDGLGDTIRPRLDALGADPTRIHALTAVRRGQDEQEAVFSLLDDLASLESAIIRLRATFVVIDPLNAYLARVDSHRAAEVRGALAPIAAMAERTRATILVVHHTNKGGGDGRALNRATGSGDFVAAPRSVLLVAPDPDDESRRCLVSAKLNLARKPPGLGFSIIDGGIVFDDKPVTLDANQLLTAVPRNDKEATKLAEARAWLADYLGDGGQPQKQVKTAAKNAGVSDRTLWRAKDALGVVSLKDGMTGGWTWNLPSPITAVRLKGRGTEAAGEDGSP